MAVISSVSKISTLPLIIFPAIPPHFSPKRISSWLFFFFSFFSRKIGKNIVFGWICCRERNQSVTTSRNQLMQGYLVHPAGRISKFFLSGVAAFQPTQFLGTSFFFLRSAKWVNAFLFMEQMRGLLDYWLANFRIYFREVKCAISTWGSTVQLIKV